MLGINMKHMKIIIAGVICLVCIVAFCFVAITGGIYELKELPLNFTSAFLGAMVTAILMFMLLTSQSTTEEIKERNVIVFRKKSVIYEDFIKRLYKVLQKQKINGNTYRKINSEFYTKLVLYLKKESQRKITEPLARLAECIRIEMNDGNAPYALSSSDYLADLNKNYYKLRDNIFSIINILIHDLGLGGNMDVNMQDELERSMFSYLLSQTLLEEADNLFIKKDSALFNKAFYSKYIDGPFIIIPIKGKRTPGGRIEIGPFSNSNKNELLRKNLIFRLLSPQFNPLAESYASGRESNIEGKYVEFSGITESEFDEYDQINLTIFNNSDLEKLEKMGVKKEDIYNDSIYPFGFDDSAYTLYYRFYVSVCKAIAARAYFYFFTARTAKDGKPIKQLCEEFGEVTDEEITNCIAQKRG